MEAIFKARENSAVPSQLLGQPSTPRDTPLVDANLFWRSSCSRFGLGAACGEERVEGELEEDLLGLLVGGEVQKVRAKLGAHTM